MFLIEYSSRQDCFHIAYVDNAAKSNLRQLKRGYGPDWVVVGFGRTREEVHEQMPALRELAKTEGWGERKSVQVTA